MPERTRGGEMGPERKISRDPDRDGAPDDGEAKVGGRSGR